MIPGIRLISGVGTEPPNGEAKHLRTNSAREHVINTIVVEMCKSKSVHMFANVVADATASEAWDGGSVRDGDRLETSPLTTTRESACPPGCRVCFLARKYGLTPREVTLIALISSGKSGRAISQTLGIGMPTIRKYCGIIHGKIGTHSRLAIGLWAIREGMVKSAVQPKLVARIPDPYMGCPTHEIQIAPEGKL
jgi:DNA-binding CsgD family transcriptional regulator